MNAVDAKYQKPECQVYGLWQPGNPRFCEKHIKEQMEKTEQQKLAAD